LADDAMEAHEFGVHRDVGKSDRIEEFLAQRNRLVDAVLAAVISIRAYVGMWSGTVGGRMCGAGGRPAIVAATRVVGASVIGPSPPITRGVIAMSCARAGGEVWWRRIIRRSCVRMISGGRGRIREAPGLDVRPNILGGTSRGRVICQGLQTCTGRWRRGHYRSGVD
jgi:hypothetical protein